MANLLDQAINCNDGHLAAKIIQDALGITVRQKSRALFSTWGNFGIEPDEGTGNQL